MLNAIIMMLAVGGILGLILGVAAKVLYVPVDERMAHVITLLPGYNCGGCGYPGCSGMAEALVTQEINQVSICKPSNADQRSAIVTYLNETTGPNGEVLNVKV